MRLQTMLMLMAPFVLVALFHSHRLTGALAGELPGGGRPRISLIGAGRHPRAWRPPAIEAERRPAPPVEEEEVANAPEELGGAAAEPGYGAEASEPEPEHVLELTLRAAPAGGSDHASVAAAKAAQSAATTLRRVLATKHYEPPLGTEPDPSLLWPAPTLSAKRLLDGSANWLPVPDAESAAPSDLAWRSQLTPGVAPPHCPKGRRPYHTILTAQASTYQEWQTKIMHYHFRKIQRDNPCTEMTGFTRLLVSNSAQPDGLMSSMPTLLVPQLGFDKTKGFQATGLGLGLGWGLGWG